MILPNREKAYIPSPKLNSYLLSTSHSSGRGKAKFFRKFGFNESNSHSLESELLFIAQTEEVVAVTKSPFGTKFIINGAMLTPTDININIRTIWIIETGEDTPRFVTAYPRPK